MDAFTDLDNISKMITNADNKIYFLKNKDISLLSFKFEEVGVSILEVFKDAIVPSHVLNRFDEWLESRTPPKHREYMKKLFIKLQIDSKDTKAILDYSKGLSLIDTLWITCDTNLKWEQVSLYRNQFDEVISKIAFDGGMYGEAIRTTSPELTTDGALPKCWIKEEDGIYLYKRGTSGAGNTGYEPYSEAMATQVCEWLGLEHTHYDVVNFRGKLASKCLLVTNEKVSMMPLYLHAGTTSSAGIEKYCIQNGLADQFYNMLLLDYIIMNTDRHLGNFAVLVDSDDFSLKGMMPIYDNGMSCLCYYREHMYKSLDEYIEMYSGEFERNSYSEISRILKGSSCDLKKLLSFKFDRSRLLDCPADHIDIVENFIRERVRDLLSLATQ